MQLKKLLCPLLLVLVISNFANDSITNTLWPDTFDVSNNDHYINYAANLINSGELDLALKVINTGLDRAIENNDDYLESNLNYYLADFYYFTEEYDSAQALYLHLLPKFTEQCDTLMMAKTLNSLGILFGLQLDYEKTLNYYVQEAELLNLVKHPNRAIQTERLVLMTNFINLYSNEEEYQKTIYECESAIKLAIELNDSLRLGSLLNSKALAQKNLGKYKIALTTFKEASNLFHALGDEFRIAFIDNNIGGVYEIDEQNLDSALYYYQKALTRFTDDDYQYGISMSMLGVASVLSKKGSYSEAANIYQQAKDISQKHEFYEVLPMVYSGLAELEYDRENYKLAYDYITQYNILNDSLYSNEKHKQFAELEAKYKVVQKENEINLLRNEKLTQQLKLEKMHLQRLIGIIILVSLLITSIIYGIFYNQKRKANRLLRIQNKKIEEQNIQLREMNDEVHKTNKSLQQSKKELTIANESKNKFFSILGHDLRNPIHNILGQSFLLSKTYDKLNKEERMQYADEMYVTCEQINRLLDNLLEWSKTQSKSIEFSPEETNINELIKNAFSLLTKSAQRKSIELGYSCPTDLSASVDAQMLETVIRNLVNNGIKFTNEGGKVFVKIEKDQHKLCIEVADNGVGINKSDLRKLFKIRSDFKTKGTNMEQGTGLGLVICKEFIDLHKGKLWVESEVGVGSTFFVEIPIS